MSRQLTDLNILWEKFGKGMTAGTQKLKPRDIRTCNVKFRDLSISPMLRMSSRLHNSVTKELMKCFEVIETIKIKDILNGPIRRGKQPETTENGSVYAIKTSQVKNGYIDLGSCELVTEEFYSNASNARVKKGDVLIASTGKGSLGKVSYVDFEDDAMVDGHVSILRIDKEKYNPVFLAYFLRSPLGQFQMERDFTGATNQIELYGDEIRQFDIPAICPQKQSAILEDIRPIEDEIKKLQTKVENLAEAVNKVFSLEFGFDLKQLDKEKMVKIFNSSLLEFSSNRDLRGSYRFHCSSGKYITDFFNKITTKKIKDYLAKPIELGASISPSYYDEDGDRFYISMAAIRNWRFDSEVANRISGDYYESNMSKSICKNDIILARSGEGTIGKVALIEDDVEAIFCDFTMRIKLEGYCQKFAYYYFATDYFQHLINIHKKGLGNNTNIFPVQLREFPLLDVSKRSQSRIVAKVEAEIAQQEKIKIQIEQKREKIDQLIVGAILDKASYV